MLARIFRRGKRIVATAAQGFFEDDSYTKSSTLTFYTVQSIIPFFAFLLGIAKGFGFDAYVENLIEDAFVEQREVATYFIEIAKSMLKHIQEGVAIGIGVLLLIWAMINLLGYIEVVLNQIWKIKEQRSALRKINDYVAFIIVCPLILIASSSFTVFLKTRLAHLQGPHFIEVVSVYLLLVFKIAPWVLSWLLFFSLYFFLPNAKLRIWPLLIAAVIAGTVFQIWQFILINFQIQIFNYNVIYGTFAVIPLLLIWLQVSWLIALAGAELAASIDNVVFYDTDHQGKLQEPISRKQLGLLVLLQCLKPFYSGQTAATDVQISKTLKIPLNFTRTILDILTKGEILSAVQLKEGSMGYQPFCDPEQMTVKKVCDMIEKSNDFEIALPATEDLQKILALLEKLDDSEKRSESNLSLNVWVHQFQSEV